MIPAARIAAAIEVLADIEARRRPAADALKDWGLARRFAGSGDRAAIAGLVYDALRRKASSAWIMGEVSPRAEILGALKQLRGLSEEEIAALFTGEGHAPAPLSEAERERLRAGDLSGAPAHVQRRLSRMAGAGLRREFRRTGARRGQGARQPRAGRPARQYAEDRSRQCAGGARPSRRRFRRPSRRSACASRFAPTAAARR